MSRIDSQATTRHNLTRRRGLLKGSAPTGDPRGNDTQRNATQRNAIQHTQDTLSSVGEQATIGCSDSTEWSRQ